MKSGCAVGLRWTIGDVSENGWEALRLSILGAQRVFGPEATYAVCVNSVPLASALGHFGSLRDIEWQSVTRSDLPPILRTHLDEGMAEGVAWKLAPLRVFPERWEISLDNDCILWDLPAGIRRWLADRLGGGGDVGRFVLDQVQHHVDHAWIELVAAFFAELRHDGLER